MRRNTFIFIAFALALLLPLTTHADYYEAAIPLETPRKKVPRQGGPADKVIAAITIPDGVKTVRGVVVNPFYVPAAKQEHWGAATAHWDFAMIGANFADVKNDEMAARLQDLLNDFAKQSGHAELKHAPMCFVGMSAGGGMSTRFAELFPDRTIAAAPVCLEVGPRSKESYAVPMVTIFGERDGKQMEKLAEKLPTLRAEGARFATAVQWRLRHDFARANNMAMPFFDHAIRLRLPADASYKDGPPKLRDIPLNTGWLGDRSSWKTSNPRIAPAAGYTGDDAHAACWLPDRYTAYVWRSFVSHEPSLNIKSPAGMGDGEPFKAFPTGEPVTVTINVKGDAKFASVTLMDGDRKLADCKPGDGGAFTATFTPDKAGIVTLIVEGKTDGGEVVVSKPNVIVVQGE